MADGRSLVRATWRTWGVRGVVRRAGYEASRRAGSYRTAEQRWAESTSASGGVLRSAGVVVPASVTPPPPELGRPMDRLRLYGGLWVTSPVPPSWHEHPVTGHAYPADAHWSELSDAVAAAGDIKDVWEPARLGWLQPVLRHAVSAGDHEAAELVWATLESWHAANPPYRGVHWMSGQEAALRAIAAMFLADALDDHPATTQDRRLLVGALVQDAVGRVVPSLGYALSQRNNHATSEAGFLWTASLLAPWLPGAATLRQRAARALAEATADQFAADGSYAQHSPTYHRVALHVLLWVLAVSRATGEPPPPGVADAVGRSVPHLHSLVAPGSGGRVPNLGGNDGALVFDLAPCAIGDLRPLLAHAAAATGQATDLGPGPWDEEAAWFGLAPVHGVPRPPRRATTTHALTRGGAHAVVRAGHLRHRPAHADQLHVDVWLDGTPVAVDAGAYRYTAPEPWANALAGDDVHNVPRRPGSPQAQRAGRFSWRRWQEATVVRQVETAQLAALVGRLLLPDGTVLLRLVAVAPDVVAVADAVNAPHRAVGDVEVRWNLPADAEVHHAGAGASSAGGAGWRAHVLHGGPARMPDADPDLPASGWLAPTYAVLEPCRPLVVGAGATGAVTSAFVVGADPGRAEAVATAVAALDPRRFPVADLAAALSAGV
ncbi:MAG: heparinase II/III family protein [Actinobacteria bacterium]|nr:heparinase II/III family protein [Actinomycetota bacterium]